MNPQDPKHFKTTRFEESVVEAANVDWHRFDWHEFLSKEVLPADYRATAEQWFVPLAADIAHRAHERTMPLVVGINGSQGSGKSTLGNLLCAALHQCAGLSVATLSLDDFYLTKQQRQHLAATVHPLLGTRGVPGTHDTALMLDVLGQLLDQDLPVALPGFDKAVDDRTDPAQWHQIGAPIDVVILEGWCLGVQPQAQSSLATPVNALETNEDPEGVWRRFANDALAGDYQTVFSLVDLWVMLAAPGFDCVWRWRCEQEQKLADRLANQSDASNNAGNNAGLMSPAQIERFVQFYQRLTEWGLETLPQRVDYFYQLDANRAVIALKKPRNHSMEAPAS